MKHKRSLEALIVFAAAMIAVNLWMMLRLNG